MVTFDDAKAAAEETRQRTRALAHATRALDAPQDTYQVLGALSPVLSSLSQAMAQLAQFHDQHAHHAATDRDVRNDGSTGDGARIVRLAAAELRDAADTLLLAEAQVDRAHQLNARLIWTPEQPEPPPPAATGERRREPTTAAVSRLGPSEPLASGPTQPEAPHLRGVNGHAAGMSR
ncbi:MAG: hypothetical protein JWR83_3284 [Aeromicrobium sp.]|nr:hypothetical protein [Aeromicrobium sp.]